MTSVLPTRSGPRQVGILPPAPELLQAIEKALPAVFDPVDVHRNLLQKAAVLLLYQACTPACVGSVRRRTDATPYVGATSCNGLVFSPGELALRQCLPGQLHRLTGSLTSPTKRAPPSSAFNVWTDKSKCGLLEESAAQARLKLTTGRDIGASSRSLI